MSEITLERNLFEERRLEAYFERREGGMWTTIERLRERTIPKRGLLAVALVLTGVMVGKNISEMAAEKVATDVSFVGNTSVRIVDAITLDVPVRKDICFIPEIGELDETGWEGTKLTAKKGVNNGPTGKETYYNLNMNRVVKNMHKLGYSGEYWIREDGVKMFGDYIMVAANLKLYPRGTVIETSLGTGIVCDTGEFAADNSTQCDIAVNW